MTLLAREKESFDLIVRCVSEKQVTSDIVCTDILA